MKKLLALLLCLTMLFSLLPAVYAAETDPTEPPPIPETTDVLDLSVEAGAIDGPKDPESPAEDGVPDDPNDPDETDDPDNPDDPDETETSEEPVPVRVVFVCDPEDLEITVYDPAALDEDGEPTVIEPEEDGSWLLLPGSYLYDAGFDGFLAVGKTAFTVEAQEEGVSQMVEVWLEEDFYSEDCDMSLLAVRASPSDFDNVLIDTTGWYWPAGSDGSKTITSLFGRRYINYGSKWHPAIDIGCAGGSAVYASKSGIVVATYDNCNSKEGSCSCKRGVGNYVVIYHGKTSSGKNVYSAYLHLKYKGLLVSEGQRVSQGQPIAYSSGTGHGPYANHLDFRICLDHVLTKSGYDAINNGYFMCTNPIREQMDTVFDETADPDIDGEDFRDYNLTYTFEHSEHIYDIPSVTKEPTRTVSGVRTISCIFNDASITEEIPALNMFLVPDGLYAIRSRRSGTWLTSPAEKGQRVYIMGNEDPNDYQLWQFTRSRDGSYSVINKGSGLALDVSGGSGKSGAAVQVYTPNGTRAQYWHVTLGPDGYVQLMARCSYYPLDVCRGDTEDGTYVQQYTSNQTDAQCWGLIGFEEEREEITLHFVPTIGTSSVESITVIKGQPFGELPVPSTSYGFAFRGWSRNALNDLFVQADDIVEGSETEITLYARWNTGSSFCVMHLLDNTDGAVLKDALSGNEYRLAVAGESFASFFQRALPGYSVVRFVAVSDTLYGTLDALINADGDYDVGVYEVGPETFTISLDPQGGTVSPSSISVTSGGVYGELPTPSREDYVFQGWYTSSGGDAERITADSAVKGSVTTLYARWILESELPRFYTVDYYMGSQWLSSQWKVGGSDLVLDETVPQRDEVAEITGCYYVLLESRGGEIEDTLPTLPFAIGRRYAFRCWNTSPDGSGDSYAPGAVYGRDESVTLYAQWDLVSFVETAEIPTPYRAGRSFLGWSEDAAAVSGFVGNYTPTDNVTLYAIWNPDPDLNDDGATDAADLSLFASIIKTRGAAAADLPAGNADLDGSGVVNAADLVYLTHMLKAAG